MRLNNKTIRSYLFYSFLIFLLTIPLFYFVMRSLLLHEVDKSLRLQLKEIRSNLGEIHSQDELTAWSKLDKDILLSPIDEPIRDRVYSINRYSPKHEEEEPYREIAGGITVGGKMYRLVISSSLIENDDLLSSILLVQSIVLFLLICGMLWINQRISKRLWQPFYVALRNMQQFELNKQTNLSFLSSTTDEFNELNKAIGNLFSRSSEIFLQQKEFTENAAHEMQTPLAIYQSKLELLMQTSPLSEEQADLINGLDDTNRRLIKLNKSLLLLTKIENHQYQDVYDVEIGALCKRLILQSYLHAEEKNIVINGDFPERVVVRVNPVLIEILIGNLLSNAIRYNINNGMIMVRTEKNTLVIENTGASVPLPDKVFDRFYKQTGQAGTEDSTGLGLAIVKNICTLYNYTISYAFIEGRHIFRLDFHNGSARQGAGS
ncbi:MAG: HAMP domain-containing histidine kinase [Chitinophagaceae bacterium]|nr:HAMP domain-containing histidine kinase [Chitinophagaceae bacterium]